MSEKRILSESALSQIVGGNLSTANPAAGLSREDAEAIAAFLGEGSDMGSWKTMSGQEFMEWLKKKCLENPLE